MEGLLVVLADAHYFADGLHLGPQFVLQTPKLLKGPAGELHDDIIAGGRVFFERSVAPVGDFIQRQPAGQKRRDVGDRKTGRLRSEGRGSRGARVDFDHHHASRLRIVRELDVRAADDLDGFDDVVGVFLQSLLQFRVDRQHGSGTVGVARVDPHGVDVFDEADGDHLILRVADDFQFEFFPTLDRFFDQHLSDDTRRKTPRRHFTELVHIVNESSSGTAHRIGGPHDRRQADAPENGLRLLQRVRDFALGHGDAQAVHRVFEGLSVLAAFNGIDLDADHLHAVFFQHARLVQLGGEVQSRLTAKIRQQCIRPLFPDDLGHRLDRKRFDVRDVGRAGVGHDRGRVGVGQDDLVAETPQRLACLRAGIVEFTRLTDDDRTGTDDHHFFNIGVFWHGTSRLAKGGVGLLGRTRWVGAIRSEIAGSQMYSIVAGGFGVKS